MRRITLICTALLLAILLGESMAEAGWHCRRWTRCRVSCYPSVCYPTTCYRIRYYPTCYRSYCYPASCCRTYCYPTCYRSYCYPASCCRSCCCISSCYSRYCHVPTCYRRICPLPPCCSTEVNEVRKIEPPVEAPSPAESAPTPAPAPPVAPPTPAPTEASPGDAPSPKADTASQPSPFRMWTDNTGKFHVEAQFVSISTDGVRLLRSDGRYCVLQMRRLSNQDRQYVGTVQALATAN